MLASELISQLQKIIAVEGDLEISLNQLYHERIRLEASDIEVLNLSVMDGDKIVPCKFIVL